MGSEKDGGSERVFMLPPGELESERSLLGGLGSHHWGIRGRVDGLQGVIDRVLKAHCGEYGVNENDILSTAS